MRPAQPPEGASGLAYTTGYAGGPPVMAEIPYVDYTAGEHTVFAVMTALMHQVEDRPRPIY